MKLSEYWTVYRAGKVKRIHTEPGITQENLAEHSHGVAMTLALMHPNPHGSLLKAALLHDLGEFVSGDIPSPIKRASPAIKQICDDLQHKFFADLRIAEPELHEQDELALHIADKFDFAMWAYYEFKLGNKMTKTYVERTKRTLYELEDKCHGDTRTFVGKINTLVACILQEMNA